MQARTRFQNLPSLTLQYQDEAYTLAYYLLGDEVRAMDAVEVAVRGIYQGQRRLPNQFRLEIFRRVLDAIRPFNGFDGLAAGQDELSCRLKTLTLDQRSALVLVDIMGLDYAQTCQVLGLSQKRLGRLIAEGRIGLSRQLALA